MMKEQEAISYLESLERGQYVTVNIPISKNDNLPITAMYLGKDEQGRYNFADSGRFVFSKEFIKKGKISLDKEYDGDKAFEIYANLQKEIRWHLIHFYELDDYIKRRENQLREELFDYYHFTNKNCLKNII